MYAPLEYRQCVEAQNLVMEAIRDKSTSAKDLASLVRSLCMLVTVKREYREAAALRREGAITLPKESLLVEATPDGTGREGGQS